MKPELLVEYVRDGLVEQEHFGYIVRANKNRIFNFKGNTKHNPFYLRSCAKPLQATLLIDYEMDKIYDMSEEEIALCCASHAGEEVHRELAQGLLNKIGLNESYLKCGLHKPLSKTEQKKLYLTNKKENILHNNCSGKHIMMLGICKIKGWDLKTYDDSNHPLQNAIREKINSLCNVTKSYPETKDGCGVPVMSMPLSNMLQGYLKVFKEYEQIKNAFLKHPYIIGGEDRTDTKIIENSSGIIAKVGAGGLCIIVNTNLCEAFVVKICDADMKARELVTVQLLKNLNWADIPSDNSITTINGSKVGEIIVTI